MAGDRTGAPNDLFPADPNHPADETASVELRDVSKWYGPVIAVDGISLVIERGEFVTLLGPSGCGKSTTLRIIGGFESPTSGAVLIDGQDMAALPPYRRPVNTVFQHYALFPHMSVGKNIAYGLRMVGLPRKERRRRVDEALDLVRLPHVEHRGPAELSGGQQQRVALARALVNRPRVLLLDEPLGALDLKLRQAMQRELKRINREVGVTFIYVTHDQEEALAMSDRIAVMNDGRILQAGAPDEIYERPRNRFVADFIGQTNFLEGPVLEADAGLVTVEIVGSGSVRGRAPAGTEPRGMVTVAVRPEKLAFAGDFGDFGPPDGWSVLSCTVAELVYLGTHTQHVVRLPGGSRVVVHRQNRALISDRLTPGEKTDIAFDPQAATILTE
ncbi:MAG: ABC transporter ATP-binding protein [Thermomicrobiales bacterium]